MVHAGKTERGARTPKLLHSAMHISPGIHVHRGTEVYTTEPELRDPSGQEGGMHAQGVRARSLDPYLLGSVFGSILCSDIYIYISAYGMHGRCRKRLLPGDSACTHSQNNMSISHS